MRRPHRAAPLLLISLSGCGLFDRPADTDAILEVVAPSTEAPAPTPLVTGPPDRPPSCAADPIKMVRAAYGPYLSDTDPVPLAKATCWTTDMGTTLATATQAAEESGTALLGFDPLVNAQEWSIDAVMIERRSDLDVVAHFANFGTAQSVHWTLQDQDGALRVADLHTDSWRLSDRLTP